MKQRMTWVFVIMMLVTPFAWVKPAQAQMHRTRGLLLHIGMDSIRRQEPSARRYWLWASPSAARKVRLFGPPEKRAQQFEVVPNYRLLRLPNAVTFAAIKAERPPEQVSVSPWLLSGGPDVALVFQGSGTPWIRF